MNSLKSNGVESDHVRYCVRKYTNHGIKISATHTCAPTHCRYFRSVNGSKPPLLVGEVWGRSPSPCGRGVRGRTVPRRRDEGEPVSNFSLRFCSFASLRERYFSQP